MEQSMSLTGHGAGLARALGDYQARWPREAATVQAFMQLLEQAPDAFVRQRLEGHFTASALVVSADGQRTLLTHHRKLDRWLQPGGHADGDTDLAAVALREAEEETGVAALGVGLEGRILDLDRHWIPERPGEPGHWHYDVRYLVRAGGAEDFVVSAESHALAWLPLASVLADPRFDASMRRLASKWLAAGQDGR
jgi:8-oxo-dGTP pyrophosphatase MutT (NUDIX family)